MPMKISSKITGPNRCQFLMLCNRPPRTRPLRANPRRKSTFKKLVSLALHRTANLAVPLVLSLVFQPDSAELKGNSTRAAWPNVRSKLQQKHRTASKTVIKRPKRSKQALRARMSLELWLLPYKVSLDYHPASFDQLALPRPAGWIFHRSLSYGRLRNAAIFFQFAFH